MALTIAGNSPIKVTGTAATSEDITTDEIFVKFITWYKPTTVGHLLNLNDGDGNNIITLYCDTADESQLWPIYTNCRGLACDDMDSGTLFIFRRQEIFTQTHGTWGERLRTFSWDGGIVTLLWLKPNQRCSWHSHKASWNRFICIRGKIGIKTDKDYITELTPKQMFEVEPGVRHEFQTYEEEAIIEEIAYVKYDDKDIDRETLGGSLDVGNE